MVAEKEQLTKIFSVSSEYLVLEIMSDESGFISKLAKNVSEVETIEEDSGMACSASWNDLHTKVHNHFVFCGHPYDFLKKKIEEHAKIDIIIVNADRLERSDEIWSLIERLEPRWVLLTYRENRIGEYNKRLMKAGGFKVVKQDSELNNVVSKRFCVGCKSRVEQ